MAWITPRLPRQHLKSKVGYWQKILEIPAEEPAAPILRTMAAVRLFELQAFSETDYQAVLAKLPDPHYRKVAD
jgi:hypothetical protein